MKSKLLGVFYGIAFLTLGLVVMSFIRAERPTSVAEKFLSAIDIKDYDGAKKYCTEDTKMAVDQVALIDDAREAKPVKRSFTGEAVEGDKATVSYNENGMIKTIQLAKVNDAWLIAMTKDDFMK